MTPLSEKPSVQPVVSDRVRAVVTVAIGVYLVGLVLAIMGNGSSGASALVRTIKSRLYSPSLVPAWLDVGHDHHLTYGMPEDADHVIELRAGEKGKVVRLPVNGRGERAARWRRLAAALAPAADGDERAVALLAAVGAGGFDEAGSEDLTVRVLRRRLPERLGAPIPDGFEQAATARVRRIGGEIQLIKSEPAGEVAPLVTPDGVTEEDTP
jgi:hypothetical protein